MNTWVPLFPVSCVLCVIVQPSVSCPKVVLSVCFAYSELVLLDLKLLLALSPIYQKPNQ